MRGELRDYAHVIALIPQSKHEQMMMIRFEKRNAGALANLPIVFDADQVEEEMKDTDWEADVVDGEIGDIHER